MPRKEPLVATNIHQLLRLINLSPRARASLISISGPDLIETFNEICFNLDRKNIECGKEKLKYFKKYNKTIKKLAAPFHGSMRGRNKKISSSYKKHIEQQRAILLQSGNGFLSSLIVPVIVDLASHFIGNYLKKRRQNEAASNEKNGTR